VRARDDHLAAARLWLPSGVLETMVTEARRTEPLESGGVLLGWHDQEDLQLVVASVFGPGPEATHQRTRFSPDGDWQREQIAKTYEASGRTVSYLGDWHSHPGGSDSPSRRDERTARRIARSRSARARQPLMLILPGKASTWRPAAYRFVTRRLRRIEIEHTIE
jgi:integrative and conjugative element protein (TIGR02256 family)